MAGQVLLRRRGSDPATTLIGGGWDGAMERAIAAQLAYQRAAAISGVDVSRETQLQSVRLAGASISLIRDALDEIDAGGAEDAQIREFLSEQARLLRTGETLLILVSSNLSSGSNGQQVMGDLIESGDVDGLIDAINFWAGPRGVLTGAPYSMDGSDLGN
jgi:hypothetical protein